MQKIIYILFITVICYGIYNKKHKKKHDEVRDRSILKQNMPKLSYLKEELSNIDSVDYEKKYIISVINHGSFDLGYRDKIMEGGYASVEDAEKIACYVLLLSGKSCKKGYKNDAPMFFTSLCGGCHGNDGKGLNGKYPDLTRKKLLGIQKREEYLQKKIETLEN